MLTPIANLLPHAPPMRLLDAVVHFEGDAVECTATLQHNCPFSDERGAVDPMITIELVAQAAAAWAALSSDASARPGVVASCRDARFENVQLSVGDHLLVRATRIAGSADFGSFVGTVLLDSAPVATISFGVVLGAGGDGSGSAVGGSALRTEQQRRS